MTVVTVFQKLLNKSDHKSKKKIWVDKGSDFYNDIEMFSTHNEGR